MKTILLFGFLMFTCLNAQPIHLKIYEKDGLLGYKNKDDKVIIEARYTVALDFSEKGIAFVADTSGWICIDTHGNILLRPFIYDNGPDYFSEGLARFIDNGKIGFFDESGKIVIKAQWDFAYPFNDGKAAVCNGCKMSSDDEHKIISGGEWGYIDKTGKIIISIGSVKADSIRANPHKVELLKI